MSFDSKDVSYLASNLSVKQLRHEVHRAELRAFISDTYRGTEYEAQEDQFPWGNYVECCQEAIKRQRQNQPKPQPATGRVDAETIKARVDIVSVIEGYANLRKTGQRFIGSCPLHSDRHPSLVVYPDQQSWHCYQCNQGGDLFSFIQAVENTDFRGAAAILGGR